MIGRRLSSYLVVEKLGEGGMGAVYLARDERLGRDVALKIPPPTRLGDEVARSQFRKEAKALLRLSHPHVATLLDFGSENGTDYLVMERVSGPTLDVVKRRGALPEKEVIRLGAQLARGLKAAHEAGVVHRDLKPSNLALTPDGMLKILDFGLARVEKETGAEETTSLHTAPGALAGTPAYMAPEQVRGEAADVRTDVYGAGAVLYELATGRQLFEGKKGAELTSAILTEVPPPPRAVISSVSPELDAVILKALDKDPELRYQSARELLVDLDRLARGALAPTSAGIERAGGWRRLLGRSLVVAAALALVALGVRQLLSPGTPRITQVRRITGGLGPPADIGWVTDGVRLYYVGAKAGGMALYQVAAGGESAEIPLPFAYASLLAYVEKEAALLVAASDTLGASRDVQGNPLWLVPVPTGAPRRLGNLVGWWAALSGDGERLAVGQTRRLLVARANGSDARALDFPAALAGVDPAWPSWSPDGRKLRVTARGPDGTGLWIWEVPLDGGTARALWPGRQGGWTADGRYFVFEREDDLYAAREGRRWPWQRSSPVRLTFGPLRFEMPGSSLDGRRLFAWGTLERQRLLRHDSSARRFVPFLGGGPTSQVAPSPDDRWLAWVRVADGTLWRARSDGTERLQLTAPPLVARLPRWSPDGRRIVFTASRPGTTSVVQVVSAEGGEAEVLTGWPKGLVEGPAYDLWDPCWLEDGRTVVFSGLSAYRPNWEDVGPIGGAAYANWARDGESIIGLNPVKQRIERRSLRTGRIEVVADVHELRLDWVAAAPWVGLGPDDVPLVVENQSTSDLYALDWEAP